MTHARAGTGVTAERRKRVRRKSNEPGNGEYGGDKRAVLLPGGTDSVSDDLCYGAVLLRLWYSRFGWSRSDRWRDGLRLAHGRALRPQRGLDGCHDGERYDRRQSARW